MKHNKLFLIAAILALVTTLTGGFSRPILAASTVVKVVPSAASVAVGGTTTVAVNVQDVTNLFGAEVHLLFDANLLEVVDADAGSDGTQIAHGNFLKVEFVAQNTVNNTNGSIDYSVSQMGSEPGKSGSGTLATITFKGKAAGTANIVIVSVLLADQGAAAIPATTQNASLAVTGSGTVVPTATTTVVPTATTTVTPPPGCVIQGNHTVKAGETLYSIGRAYATLPAKIASCNGIVNPNAIYPGMVLKIPVAPWSPIPAGPVAVKQFTPGGTVTPTPSPTPSPTCKAYHVIKAGETLTLIAWKYGTSIWAIANANHIANVNLIYAGATLCIPN